MQTIQEIEAEIAVLNKRNIEVRTAVNQPQFGLVDEDEENDRRRKLTQEYARNEVEIMRLLGKSRSTEKLIKLFAALNTALAELLSASEDLGKVPTSYGWNMAEAKVSQKRKVYDDILIEIKKII